MRDDQRPEGADVGADPARAIDDRGPLDDARQRRPEGLAEARHDACHRRAIGRLPRRAARSADSAPGRALERAGRRSRSTAPQSTRPRRAVRSARRPSTVAAAPIAEPRRKPACQRRSARQPRDRQPRRRGAALGRVGCGRARPRLAHARTRELDGCHVGECLAEQPLGDRAERVDVAGGQLDVRGGDPCGRLKGVDRQQLRERDAVADAESTIAIPLAGHRLR